MAKKPGDTFGFQFTTQSTAGALTDADSTPTAVQVRNGVDDSTNAVAITHISTGLYKATGTILGTYSSGDDFQVRVNAVVGGTTSGGLHDYGALDSKRVSDLHDLAAGAAMTITLSQTGLSPRALDSVADASLTVGDGLVAAICAAAGKESVSGTTYLVKTPSTGTTIRTLTLDSGTTPTSRS